MAPENKDELQDQNENSGIFGGSFFGNKSKYQERTYNIPIDRLTGMKLNSGAFASESQEFTRNQTEQTQIMLTSLQEQMMILRKGLHSIAQLIQKDSEDEEFVLSSQAKDENQLLQNNVRTDRENNLETRIQPEVFRRINIGTAAIGGLFERISKAVQFLLAGIFTTQLLKWFSAEEEGNKEKADKAKGNLLKTTGFIIAGLVAIKGGFFLVKLAIRALISKVVGLLFGGVRMVLTTAIQLGKNLIRGLLQGAGKGLGGLKNLTPKAAPAAATTAAKAGQATTATAASGGIWKALSKGGMGTLGKGLGKVLPGLNIGVNLWSMTENLQKGNYGRAALNAVGTVFPLAGLAELGIGMYQDANKSQQVAQKPETKGSQESTSAPNVLDNFKFDMPEMSFNQSVMENNQLNDMRSMVQTKNFNIQDMSLLKTEQPEETIKTEVSPTSSMMPSSFQMEPKDMKMDQSSQNKIWDTIGTRKMEKVYEAPNLSTMNEFVINNENIVPNPFTPENISSVGPLKDAAPNVIIATSKPEPQLKKESSRYTTDVPLISSSNPDNIYTAFSKVTYNVVV